MLSPLTRCAKNLLVPLSCAANQLFRRLTEPARPNRVTGTWADLPRTRAELLAGNALLRQQLIVLCRRTKTIRLTWRERLSLLLLARCVPIWNQVLQIIKPDTRLHWHREVFRLFSQVFAAEVARAGADAVAAPATRTESIEVIHTPYAAPRANAICKRFVKNMRRECLDHRLEIGGLPLIRILNEYVDYFHQARPHTCTPRRTPA